MQFAPALLLGLLGGLHCAGMCGPLMLALPVAGRTRGNFIAGRCLYHLARVAVYCALGLLFGLVGRTLWMVGMQRWVSIFLGAVLLAGILVSPRLFEFPWIARWVGLLKGTMSGFLRTRTLTSLAVLGGLNGLLPCGLVYAACAGAAATGHWASGALFMLVFGLGTLPVMMAISLSGHLLPSAVRLRLRHLMPIGVGLLAVLLILRGMSLGIPYVSPNLTAGGGDGCCSGH